MATKAQKRITTWWGMRWSRSRRQSCLSIQCSAFPCCSEWMRISPQDAASCPELLSPPNPLRAWPLWEHPPRPRHRLYHLLPFVFLGLASVVPCTPPQQVSWTTMRIIRSNANDLKLLCTNPNLSRLVHIEMVLRIHSIATLSAILWYCVW